MKSPFFIEKLKRTHLFNMESNHVHEFYEIYYLLEGERDYFINDRTYRLSKGDLVFINRFDLHRTADTGRADHERILVNVEENWLLSGLSPEDKEVLIEPFRMGGKAVRLHVKEQAYVEELLSQVLTEYIKKPAGWEIGTRSLLWQLLLFRARRVQATDDSCFSPAEPLSPLHRKIAELVEYINANYKQPLTLTRISHEFYLSTFYLSRIFKQVTGFSFVEYLQAVRIKEARRLLRETRWKIIEVAEESGFDNVAHFGRVFKQLAGESPLQYRKRHQS